LGAALAVALLLACPLAFGAEAAEAEPPPADEPAFWSKFLDSTFALVLVFIFVPVIVTTFVAARQRDRCLKTFHQYHATVHRKSAAPLWGVLQVFSKGLVVGYREPVAAPDHPTKASYLIYEPEMQDLFAVFRFHDQITEKNQRRRTRQVRRLAHPSIVRRTWRRARNLINTLRDAFNKALGAVLGQMQKTRPGSRTMTTGSKQMESVGTELLGRVANAYEPLLEQHIASPVVLEVAGPAEGQMTEYAGHLGEYSAGYVMILDVTAQMKDKAVLDGSGAFDQHVVAKKAGNQVEVTNGLSVPVRVEAIEVGGQATPLDVEVPGGTTVALPVSPAQVTPPVAAPAQASEGEEAPPPPPPPPPAVTLAVRRVADIIAPRAHAVVRHRGVE